MLDIIDQQVLLVVLIVGTFIVYLAVPTPNILYRDNETKRDILNFEANSGCYDMKTAEVECPHHNHNSKPNSNNHNSNPNSNNHNSKPNSNNHNSKPNSNNN